MTLEFWAFQIVMFLFSMLWAIREQRRMERTMIPYEIEKFNNSFPFNP